MHKKWYNVLQLDAIWRQHKHDREPMTWDVVITSSLSSLDEATTMISSYEKNYYNCCCALPGKGYNKHTYYKTHNKVMSEQPQHQFKPSTLLATVAYIETPHEFTRLAI